MELVQLVKEHNAKIVGVVNLVERISKPIDFGVPSTALLNLPSESWEENSCPLCRDNILFTKRGRTGK